ATTSALDGDRAIESVRKSLEDLRRAGARSTGDLRAAAFAASPAGPPVTCPRRRCRRSLHRPPLLGQPAGGLSGALSSDEDGSGDEADDSVYDMRSGRYAPQLSARAGDGGLSTAAARNRRQRCQVGAATYGGMFAPDTGLEAEGASLVAYV
ncbi:hypothetical protein THAOC_26085, partial [Thalassiosira oceanica]